MEEQLDLHFPNAQLDTFRARIALACGPASRAQRSAPNLYCRASCFLLEVHAVVRFVALMGQQLVWSSHVQYCIHGGCFRVGL